MTKFNKKIYITGSSGFVGANLSDYLKKYTQFSICHLNLRKQNISKLELDSDSTIIHLAGIAHDMKKTSDADKYFEINTELTKNIFDIFLQSAATNFIFMSSVKAVADKVSGILTEDSVSNPQTPYGQSKLQAENYILKFSTPEKRVFILRPCMIHGPGNKGNLNLLYNFVKKGIPYPLAAFENKRSYLSISNLNFIINNLIINPDVPGGVYNLSDDEPFSTNAVIQLFNDAMGKKSRLWKISPIIIKVIASLGDKLKLPLNSEKLKKLTENYIVSNKKIKDVLKISRLPVSSAEGLKITIDSFLQDK
jgi:nucleoside-diphosphate-sugar epimerase